ncbi:pitrilysin family protein [uncultured Duncaniella sp.]|uniref:M16 family metallopeptidase n=1 Tax=uncultured Duncaniella sp. TaxID=2768039 RepID=UPI002659E93F|nr:pitrilysin family protein [uncultured Duncaniella sp.]
MTDTSIRYSTLSNGMRLVARATSLPVEHCGVIINAGSRDEGPELHGLAHFVEHTIFKGTGSHKAAYVRDRMELVGGELNAYTTKEETAIYSTFPAGHLNRALALIAEMVTDANFPDTELSKEKLVVGEEIDTYLDTPSDAIFDDFEEIVYEGSPLAHNILGTRESLARFTSADCRRWLEERFTPGRMVFFYSGLTDPDKVFNLADKYFRGLTRPDTALDRAVPPVNAPFERINNSRESFQAHTIIGTRIPGLLDPGRLDVALLANILGGPGMNSLLNVALRERYGLVYSIDASTSLMSDNGLLTIYFGCDPDDVKRCLRLTERVINSLTDTAISERKLEAAKRQFIGQLTVGSVNSEQVAISMGRSVLYRGYARTLSETIEGINTITPESLLSAAQALRHSSRLTLK